MQNVLVVTMPNTRSYNITTDLKGNNTVSNSSNIKTITFPHLPQMVISHAGGEVGEFSAKIGFLIPRKM